MTEWIINKWLFLFSRDQNWVKASLVLHTRELKEDNGKTKTKRWRAVRDSTQLNSTGHVTLMAKRDQKKGKKQQLINIPYL